MTTASSNLEYFLEHPGEITLNYTLPDNVLYVTTFDQLNHQVDFAYRYVIVHGCAITLCFTFIVLLSIFIKKRKSPVNVLNMAILSMVIIRSSLFISYQLGPLASLTATFTGIIKEADKQKYKISVASNACLIIVIFLIQSSFTYQIFIIFKSPEVKAFGILMSSISAVLQLVTFGFYINNAVANTRSYQTIFYDAKPYIYRTWATSLPPILFTASVILMSLVLVLKLFSAIRTRRYLGLKQFSGYHVLLIMFTQSLFIPAILNVMAHCLSAYNSIFTDVSLTLVAISLPFTTLWSTFANNARSFSTTGSIFLTTSNPSSVESDWGAATSPTKYRDDVSEDGTTHQDDFAFFPSKLSKSSSVSSTSQFTGSTSRVQGDTGSCLDGLRRLSETSLPKDILQILEAETEGQLSASMRNENKL